MRTIILAPNYREACLVAEQEGLPPRQGREWTYAADDRALHGLGPDTQFLISTRWLLGPVRLLDRVDEETGQTYTVRYFPQWEALKLLRAIYPGLVEKSVRT